MYKELIGKEYYYQSFSERNGVKISKSKIVDIVIKYLADNIRIFTDDLTSIDYKLSTFNADDIFKFEPNFTELDTQKCISNYCENARRDSESDIGTLESYIKECESKIESTNDRITYYKKRIKEKRNLINKITKLEKTLLNSTII